jgi:CheY-specific phosphatase CheX
MNDPTEAEALSASAREVLETMFFTDVAGDTPEQGDGTPAGLVAGLRFNGERPGEFRIAVTPEAAKTIAANFLGTDEEVPEARVAEVTCELANMICGSVLSRLERDLAFDLSHPELISGEAAAAWSAGSTRTFDLGNGRLTAGIRFERG